MKTPPLRISRYCEFGVGYLDSGARVDYHQQCSGKEDRRAGRNYRCKCACHKKPKEMKP